MAFGVAVVLTGYVAARLTSDWPHVPTWGLMLHPFGKSVSYQSCGFHTGQDWFALDGAPVFAIEDGVVVHVGPLWLQDPGAGRGDHSVILDHGDYYSTYGHNRRALVRIGDAVDRGQVIAELGSEGFARVPHLHLEKVVAPFTGDWRMPFEGCSGYVEPGLRWRPF